MSAMLDRWKQCLLVGAAAVMVTGCASAPSTRVILLPDEEGHVGAITVSSPGGTQPVDQPYGGVDILSAKDAPAAPRVHVQAEVEKTYARLLAAQPTKPVTVILNFTLDSTTLTAASAAQLPDVLKAVRNRMPTVVMVYGHSDSIGNDQRNLKLSADRATAVAQLLRKQDPSLPVEVRYFGDKSPLYPAADGVAEPRNRRVEVVIL